MKIKQKSISFIGLLLVVLLLFTGCSNGEGTANKGKDGDKTKIAFIPMLIGIPYFSAMEEGGKKAAEDLGVEFIYSGPTTSSAPEQSKIMDSLIRQKVDAVSVAVIDSSSINPIIKKAKSAGIKTYTADSDSPDSERDLFVAQALDEDLGYTLMDRLAAQIDEKGKIGIVSGESTATNLNSWIDYMEKRIDEKYPDIEIVDIRYTPGGSSEAALTQSQELMTKHQDLKGIVAVSSSTIPGVAQAVQQAGKAGEVAVIGYGSPATVKPFIESGVMKESILWDAYELGYLTVWAGKQMVDGKEFSEENDVPGVKDKVKYLKDEKILLLGPPLIIDKDNVGDFDF
ncbi:autoinducer 2 ABC transporter substrate-binding protein [Sporosarcina jiandibaonis]|uniref:autoinducer 2 ABC transporter substrate-binding protein n=1 Tax=Sporosarcina jiandibaonis TaxID=2715535 RepID=UPI0015574F4A|nr:autoinducer 2 ABC transporter substrate-binding protein [Sporosarcina jiandibaonis]